MPRTTESDWGFSEGGQKDFMYHTRFVVKVSITDIGQLASHVTRVIQACGEAPTSVNVIVDEPASHAVGTVTYTTRTTNESDAVIGAWREIDRNVQVERTHKLNPDQFESVALAGRNGRALRRALSRNVRELCVRGIGSKGVLDYLDECESIVVELKEFVQSMRAPV